MNAETLAVVGGGPAGLMAAEVASAAGLSVDVYEGQGSVGRKFLLAGKGGLNLTHSEGFTAFLSRYGNRAERVRSWLQGFDNAAIRDWASSLGVETMIGSSGRVFPVDLKAAPLLRGWVRRLRASGVRFHVHHYWFDLEGATTQLFRTPHGERRVQADAAVLAMGGASWPQLGSDGAWTAPLAGRGISVAPLLASNCGFDVAWTTHFVQRYAGHPVKSVTVTAHDAAGDAHAVRSEFIITQTGLEGGAIYSLSPLLRAAIAANGTSHLLLDLAPARSLARLQTELAKPHGGRSLSGHMRRAAGIDGVKAGLLYEFLPRACLQDPGQLAAAIKALRVPLLRARPVAEAISSAGGVQFDGLNEALMLRALPGIFCAGEMLDWEAPTGGYLLNACMASGRVAAAGAVDWLLARRGRTDGDGRIAAPAPFGP